MRLAIPVRHERVDFYRDSSQAAMHQNPLYHTSGGGLSAGSSSGGGLSGGSVFTAGAPIEAFDLERHTLANGLRVVLHRDTTLPLVAINLWYHVGSKNEGPGRTGFAHLFEHLLFQGSENVGTNDHFRWIQQAGGVANGSTWYDRTNYYEVLPTHYLDLGLWLESDRMGRFLPAITQEKLDNQREVVINERKQKMDNQPYGRAFERLHELLYDEGHPYRWPVIGYVDDLTAATLDDVRSFFRSYYVPRNAVLTLAGDIDYDHALSRIEHYFNDIPAGQPVVRPAAPPAALASERREIQPDDVQLPRIYMAFNGPAYGQHEWYAADLLSMGLSGGKSSPMFEDLIYHRRLAQDVGCYIFPTELTATFAVIATAKPGVAPEQLEAAINEHFVRAASEPLSEVDFERSRNQLLADHYGQLQALDRRADLLSLFTTYFDDPIGAIREVDRLRAVTREDVMAFAAERLGPQQRAVVTVVPRETEVATREGAS
ncbi:MAG: pitrilysin family protein [Acidobacteriota bacterium]